MSDECKCPPEGAPAWMATFSDMMSLLFVFFVLLLSFATMDASKFRDALGSVKEALGVENEHPGSMEGLTTSLLEFSKRESTPYLDLLGLPSRQPPGSGSAGPGEEISSQAKAMVRGLRLGTIVEVSATSRGATLRVRSQLLFDPGGAQLRPESFPLLDEIIRLTRSFPYPLMIDGHTDQQPTSGRYRSNWELSAARAIAALRYFNEVGGIPAERLSCAGYAGTRPIAPGDSVEARATNRRVEFTFTLPPELAQTSTIEAS